MTSANVPDDLTGAAACINYEYTRDWPCVEEVQPCLN